MWKYIFSGAVTPERAPMNLNTPIVVNFDHKDAKIKGVVQIEVYSNQIIISFTADEQISDLNTLKNLMTDLVSGVVECAGLIYVLGYDIDLKSVHAVQENTTCVFGIDIQGLSPTWNTPETIDISSMFLMCGENVFFRRALSDFKNSIRHPADTGFFCYRAIESLIHYFNPGMDKAKKPKAIEDMNKALNLHESCIQNLRELGGEVRHGKPVWISGENRVLAFKLTRDIILRFFNFLNSPESPEFEQLLPNIQK